MATKAELITEIGTTYTLGSLIHETPLLSAGDQALYAAENLKIYRQIVHEQSEGKMIRRAISFYVFDEGGGGEVAYYKDRKPTDSVKADPVTAFRTTVEAEIATRVAADQIYRGTIREIDESGEWAVVRVFMEDSGPPVVVRETDYFVWKKNDDSIGFMKAILF